SIGELLVLRQRITLSEARLSGAAAGDAAAGDAAVAAAVREARAIVAASDELEYEAAAAEAQLHLGQVLVRARDWRAAAAALEEAATAALDDNAVRVRGTAHAHLVEVARELGRPDQARRWAAAAQRALARLGGDAPVAGVRGDPGAVRDACRPPPGLVVHLPLDEREGLAARDLSGRGN